MKHLGKIAFTGIVLAIVPTVAVRAATFKYTADLEALNDSGVSGKTLLTLVTDDTTGNPTTLSVNLTATGLEPNQLHVQHIHGRFNNGGEPIDSVTPPPTADTDNDSFVEVAEGAPFYGPIILSLASLAGEFPTAPDGTVNFSETYDLSDSSVLADGFSSEDLFPLKFREIVVHGAFVPEGVDDSVPDGGYLASLPVAAGEIKPVPEPTSTAATLLSLGGLSWIRRRFRKANA